MAVDSAGNVYIADYGNNAIKKWTAAPNTVTTLVSSGLSYPLGVAVDRAGNVYIADTSNNAIKKWTAASHSVTTLVSGLNHPGGVAVDNAGNAYIADTFNNAIEKWTAARNSVTTLVASANLVPFGVAVDGAGNVYFADRTSGTVDEWVAADSSVTTLVSGLNQPHGVAVDGAGNVYIAETGNSAIKKWTVSNNTVTALVATGLNSPWGVAVDGAGNVYIADNAIKELPRAFVDLTGKLEGFAAGNDVLPMVLPATANLLVPFAPTGDSAWLTITGITNGVVSFTFGANTTATNRTAHLTLLGQPIAITQAAATVPIISQPANLSVCAGSPATFSVTASGDNPIYQWQVSQDGGTTFTNISATATNASYTNLSSALADNGNQYQVIVSGWLGTATSAPPAVLTVNAPATAGTGGNQTIQGTNCLSLNGAVGGCATGGIWTSSGSGTFLPNTTTLSATYCPSTGDLANGTVLLTLTSTGPCAPCTSATVQMVVTLQAPPTVASAPTNVTVCAGSPAVFSVSATGGGLTYQWQVSQDGGNTFTNISATATNASYTNTAPTTRDQGTYYQVVVGASGASVTSAPPAVLAVTAPPTASTGGDQAICPGSATTGLGGSVGAGATGGTWSASGTGSFAPNATALNATYTPSAADITAGAVTLTLSSTGQLAPCPAATAQLVVTIQRPPAIANSPSGVTVGPGSPIFLYVLATGVGLTYQWQVSQDNGMTFTNLSNAATNATYTKATTTVADNGNQYQVIVSGACAPPATSSPPAVLTVTPGCGTALGRTAALEGPESGVDSVVLGMPAATNTWTATANDAWLHLDAPSQSGLGSANVLFRYDANPGDTRTGTVTIACQTLTVTQAGATYVLAPCPVTTLVSSGLSNPAGVAVDGAGFVYIADTGNNAIKKWSPASNTVTALVASGLSGPSGVAVDRAGFVYIADYGNHALKEWSAANNAVTTLFYQSSSSVAVDGVGNLYVWDFYNVAKWTAASRSLSDLFYWGQSVYNSGLGLAVDAAGNVYLSYYWEARVSGKGYMLREWDKASGTLSTLLNAGLNPLGGMAVDGAGSVYFATTNTIGSGSTTLVSGLSHPSGVAVDSAGNVYIADTGNNSIKELPRAFVDSTAKWEGAAAGSDVLPVVLPATANLLGPFAPSSDEPWLTIAGINNGVVSFAFGANTTGANRTANVTVLGQPIFITQSGAPPTIITQQPTNQSLCAGSPAIFSVIATGAGSTYQWQVSQDGGSTFTSASPTATNAACTNLITTQADNGNQYRVIVSGLAGNATSAPPAVLTVNVPATAGAGGNQTICAGTAMAGLGGTVGGGAMGGTWSSSGTGSFAPNATTLNATYTPSAADITAGTVTLTLSTTGQLSPCGPATAQVVVTINPAATASASGNQTICAGSVTAGLCGTVGGGATGGAWSSSGTGSFAPNATTLNATYTPSAADITAGTVTLTLISTGQRAPCGAATAQVVVTINALPAITSQPTNATVCAGSPAIFTVAATGVGLTYQWQVSADGGTTFTNISDTATNASYTNATTTLADNGKQYQVIVGSVCPSQTSTQAVLTVDPIEAWVGYSYALLEPVICSNSQVPLSGTLPSGTTGFEWVGAGTFYPSTTNLDVVYTPTDAENSAGSATVSLIATNPAWATYQGSASVTVTIVRPATVSAGANQTVCSDSPQTQLEGSVGGTENSEQLGGDLWWWYGAGDFLPAPDVTNAVYTPTAAEIAAGQATLTLSAYGPWPCWEVDSTMTITINPAATASAGPNQTICAGSATAALGGTVGGGATGGLWTSSGTGTFVPDATTLSAIYTPSAGDITAGTVTLTMTSAGQQSPCGAALAQVVLTIIPVTLTPPILIGPTLLSNGLFQFAFSNNDPCASFTVLTATNLWLPLSNWTVAGPATNTAPGLFQFSTGTTNNPQGYYRVRSP